MLNPAQTVFLHSLSLYFAWSKAGGISKAFSHHIDAVQDRRHDRIIETRAHFKLVTADAFGTSNEPVEGNIVLSEAIWDKHRAAALYAFVCKAKGDALNSGNPEAFSTYLDAVSFMAGRSDFKEARVTNRLLSNVYAGLLPAAEKVHSRDPAYDVMTDYVSGLRVVWGAAASHAGHQENVLQRLQIELPDAKASRERKQSTRQVARFIEEVGLRAA